MGSPIIFRGKTLDELRAVTGQHIYLTHSNVLKVSNCECIVCFNSDGSPVVSLLSDLIRSLAEIVRDAAEKSVLPDCIGQLSSRYHRGKILQWPMKVVIAGYGQGKKWQNMREDWLMLLCMTAFCMLCWFALRKLIGTSCLFCLTVWYAW